MEKKVLMAVCLSLLLVASVVVNMSLWFSLSTAKSEVDVKSSEIENLGLEKTALEARISGLEDEIEFLKSHSFTHYTVDDDVNISNIGIFEVSEWLNQWTINGTITNISDKSIETVYVYLILRNADGTADFNYWDYEEVGNLYIGETASFEFSWVTYDESQAVEIFLVY